MARTRFGHRRVTAEGRPAGEWTTSADYADRPLPEGQRWERLHLVPLVELHAGDEFFTRPLDPDPHTLVVGFTPFIDATEGEPGGVVLTEAGALRVRPDRQVLVRHVAD